MMCETDLGRRPHHQGKDFIAAQTIESLLGSVPKKRNAYSVLENAMKGGVSHGLVWCYLASDAVSIIHSL